METDTVGEELDIPAEEMALVDLGQAVAVEFPITRFGSYVVALERDR